jgi:hypothetical protein
MTLDVQYKYNYSGPWTIYNWPTLNSSGWVSVQTDPSTAEGLYQFVSYRNTLNNSPNLWIGTSKDVNVTAPPAPPIYASPNYIQQGQCYKIYADAYMAYVTLHVQYSFNGVPQGAIYNWPSLDANGVSGDLCTSGATTPGSYLYTAAMNPAEENWTATSSEVVVVTP